MSDNGTMEVKAESPKISKLDEKRQKIYVDRLQRHMKKGLTPEQAHMKIMEEDYERLPVNDKLKRLEVGFGQALQRLANDLTGLQENDQVIADAMDANFMAVSKLLEKLGIPRADQVALLKEAEAEIKARRKAEADAKEAQAEQEQKKVIEQNIDRGGEQQTPEDATVFQG